ncbi:MAG: hypothetical protein K6F68_01860 [Clostridiales bacterium]|nr:hypothetical protein [Clostridiales bacterium]
MASVKDSWKKVGEDFGDVGRDIGNSDLGKDLGKLGKDFGKSIVKTVKHGVKAVSEWADKEDPEEKKDDIPVEEGEVIDK